MIKDFYAFVNLNEEGQEEVVGVMGKDKHGDMLIPLICHDLETVEKMKMLAKESVKMDCKKVKLIHFTKRRVVEEFLP